MFRRTQRPERPRIRVRFRPQVGFLEQRALLSVVYKNTTNPTGGGYLFEGATQIGNDLAAFVDVNKLTLAAGSAGLPITSLNFRADNFGTATVEARPTMYVWAGNGAGAPGALLGKFELPIATLASGVETRLSLTVPSGDLIVPKSMNIFAGIGFDNDNGALPITAAQLNALGGLTYHPATVGTDGPQAYFFSPDIPLNNPAVNAFGDQFGANYGWNVTAAELSITSFEKDQSATPLSSNGDYDLTYKVSGTNLPNDPNLTYAVYWATGSAAQDIIPNIPPAATGQLQQTIGTWTEYIKMSKFVFPPAGATNLIAVIDNNHVLPASDEANTVASIGSDVLQAPLSVELDSIAPSIDVAVTREQRVFLWIAQYSAIINSTANTYGIDPRAIAGAIAWEALQNTNSIQNQIAATFGYSPLGPGKIQFWGTDAQAVEGTTRYGHYLTPQNYGSRFLLLQDPVESITYAAAIMNAYAVDAQASGLYLRDEDGAAILASYYNGVSYTQNGKTIQVTLLNAPKYFTQRLQSITTNPLMPNPTMGQWVENNLDWLGMALGLN